MDGLKKEKKVIGLKQSKKAILEGRAAHVHVAADAQSHITAPILELCEKMHLSVTTWESMKSLGEACAIDVGAAVAVVLKN